MKNPLASLTSRLVLTTVVLALVVSVLIGTATTFAMRSYLTGQLDGQVRASSPQFSPFAGGGPRVFNRDGSLQAEFAPSGRSSGAVYGHESSGDETSQPQQPTVQLARPLDREALSLLADVPTDGSAHTVTLSDYGTYRVIAGPVQGGTLVVGLSTQDVDDVVSRLIWWELFLTLLAVLLAGAAATIVVRRQLRPLREVAATAHHVAELPLATGDIELAERVPDRLTDERTEVGQVGSALNTLLAHVESSLNARQESEQQVRQFVADASHELRTPLTTIAGYTELARRRPDDEATTRTALDKVEEESARMTAMVEDLLLLARLDAGRPLERRPVDLSRLLVETVSDARVVDPGHRWQLDLPEESIEVTGDVQRLHQVVTNLLTNARKYTPEGTTITVSATADGFSVHDDGPGFPPGLAEHAFERFARGDAARTRGDAGGVGLGLALVQAIVTAHGGTVDLKTRPGSTTVTVSLVG